MANLFGHRADDQGTDDQNCTSSGWTVRPATTRRNNNNEQCPTGDHQVTTTSVGRRAVRIDPHRR
jgi:hypothetical protein